MINSMNVLYQAICPIFVTIFKRYIKKEDSWDEYLAIFTSNIEGIRQEMYDSLIACLGGVHSTDAAWQTVMDYSEKLMIVFSDRS